MDDLENRTQKMYQPRFGLFGWGTVIVAAGFALGSCHPDIKAGDKDLMRIGATIAGLSYCIYTTQKTKYHP